MNNDYIEELKKCVVASDVKTLFKGRIFPNKYGSKFDSKVITVIASDRLPANTSVKLTGLMELGFRVVLYLKFDKKLNGTPQNSGEKSYTSSLHFLLGDLAKYHLDIVSLSDMDSDDIDRYIDENLSKEINPVTIIMKLNKLKEWIVYANPHLPYFLKLDENLLKGSVKYHQVREESRKIKAEQNIVGSARNPYPFENLKILLKDFIETIELYGEDILKAAKLYIDTKTFTSSGKYTEAFEYFKNSEYEFKEPSLKVLQKEVWSAKEQYIRKNGKSFGRSVNSLRDIMFEAVNKLEVSCGVVILMLTGMRAGEFSTLERNFIFSEDEHFHLTRMVYKTANTVEGERLEMPIPPIAKKALEVLAELAELKDGKKSGAILLNTIEVTDTKNGRSERIGNMLDRFSKQLGIDIPPTLHQLRHSMAFLIVHINEKDGLELARMFLGHKSITMTLQYMGHFNNELKEAVKELREDESMLLVEAITEEIQNNKKIFGEKGKRLMPSHKFVGKQASEFVVFMKKGLLKLVEEKKLAIIQTPICLCIHDLDKSEDLVCQRGFNIAEIATYGQAAPARCEGAKCGNAVFFEHHVENLGIYDDVEPNLRARLEENTHFMDNGGFDKDPYRRVVKEYKEYKKEAV